MCMQRETGVSTSQHSGAVAELWSVRRFRQLQAELVAEGQIIKGHL